MSERAWFFRRVCRLAPAAVVASASAVPPAVSGDLAAYLDGEPAVRAGALARLAVVERAPEIEAAWRSAQGDRRYRLLLALCVALPLEETVDFALARFADGTADPVERHLLAAAAVSQARRKGGSGAPGGPASAGEELRRGLARLVATLAADPDWRVRACAAELLGGLGLRRLAAPYRALVNDPMWPVRTRAIESLGRLPPGDNIALLREIVTTQDQTRTSERIMAVRALGDLGHVPGLVAALEDPNVEVRLRGVWSLGRLNPLPAEARAALEAALARTDDGRLREEIRKCLHGEFGKRGGSP